MKFPSFLRAAVLLTLTVALAAPLAACGKKGPPEAPAGEDSSFPRQYPSR